MGCRHSSQKVSTNFPNMTTSTTDITIKGLKLSAVEDFIQKCGGRESLYGLSTDDVCENYVKPMTLPIMSSYCEMLDNINSDSVQDAEVFISHAWRYNFLDVIDALYFHFRKTPNIVIWFDLFCNNQLRACSLDFTWWSTTFKTAISEIGRVVMVLAPWSNPIPLTRAWCLFELYCIFSTNGKFEVAMAINQYQAFLTDITSNRSAIHNMLLAIDAKSSECSKEEDRKQIFSSIEASVGFDGLNKLVISKMKSWVWDFLSQETVRIIPLDSCFQESEHQDVITLRSDTSECNSRSYSNQLSNIYALYDPNAFKVKEECISHLNCILDEVTRRLLLAHSPLSSYSDQTSTSDENGILSKSLLCCLGYTAVHNFCTRRESISEDMYEVACSRIKLLLDSLFVSYLSELSSNSVMDFSAFDTLFTSSSMNKLMRLANLYSVCTSKVSTLLVIFAYLDRFYCKYHSLALLDNVRDDYFANKILACIDNTELDSACHESMQRLSVSVGSMEECTKGKNWKCVATLLETFSAIFPLVSQEFKKKSCESSQQSSLHSISSSDFQVVICNSKSTSSDLLLVESHPLILLSNVLSNLVQQTKLGSSRVLVFDVPVSSTRLLLKVKDYAEYHYTNPPVTIEKPLKSLNMADLVCEYDVHFLECLSQDEICELIIIANFIDIGWLLDLCCAKVASLIKDKTPEEIRKTFNITNEEE